MARGSISKTCAHGTTGTPGRPACRVRHGSWGYLIEVGADPRTGRRLQKRRRGFASREEAEEALTAEQARLDAGIWVDDKGITLGKWLDQWLATQTHLEVKTSGGYTTCVAEWKRVLGDVRLRDLRRVHIDTALQELKTPVPRKGLRGRPVETRGASTLDSYRRVLRAALAEAVRRDLMPINHAAGKFVVLAGRRRQRLELWEPEQLRAYLDAADQDEQVGAALTMTALTGMRRGEVTGARVSELDPGWRTLDDRAGIEVVWTLVEPGRKAIPAALRRCPMCRAEHVGLLWKPRPKTEASARWVPLVTRARTSLDRHLTVQAGWRRAVGKGWVDHGLIFTGPDGNPLRPSRVSDAHARIVADLDLPPITLQKLRHSACSAMLAAGIPIDIVQMVLGHSSPEVTRLIYAHLQRSSTAEKMEAAFAVVGNRRDQAGTISAIPKAIGW